MDTAPVIDDSFKRSCLLLKMLDEVICPVLRLILRWLTPDWDQTKYDFIDYLTKEKKAEEKKINNLKKKLNPHQTDAVQNDLEAVRGMWASGVPSSKYLRL